MTPQQIQQMQHQHRMRQQQQHQRQQQQQQRFAKQNADASKPQNGKSDSKDKSKDKDNQGKGKGWMVAGIVLVFLIVGVLIAMVAYKGKTACLPAVGNMGMTQPIMMQPPPSNIPAYVGVSNAQAPPRRQWYESASVFGRE